MSLLTFEKNKLLAKIRHYFKAPKLVPASDIPTTNKAASSKDKIKCNNGQKSYSKSYLKKYIGVKKA